MAKQLNQNEEKAIYAMVADEEQRQSALHMQNYRTRYLLVLVVFIACLLSDFLYNFKQTIVSEEKSNSLNGVRSGLEIAYHPLRGTTELCIWRTRSTSQQYLFGSSTVERVLKKRWFANDSALYLLLEISYNESGSPMTKQAQIIYDFKRAELFTFCDLALWRSYNYNGGPIDKGWMTRREFDSVLLSPKELNDK